MNQILLTNNDKNKKKNNSDKTNTNDTKKIIMLFGIIILVFGIAIGGIYGYKIYKNNNQKEKIVAKPTLAIEETEGEVRIIAESEIGINKITYAWNDEEPEEIEMNGRTKQEQILDIPSGENTLTVKVIDQSGQENETKKSFSYQGDDEKPKIDTSILEAELKIVATDETAMKYIIYKWNDEEEVKVDVENENDTTIETKIDVKRGQNSIKITAVDAAGNTNTIEKILKGVNKPIIDVTRDGNILYMKMSHDKGFKKIEFSVNGKIYTYDENANGYDSTKTVIEYKFELEEGENKVIIIATSTEETEETYKGKCNYSAQ